MKVLVTGGAGFIGSHIVDQLLLRGHEVVVFDNLSSGHDENMPSGARLMLGDIVRGLPFNLTDAIETFRPDAICHQAAQPSLRRSIDDPAHDATVNIIGTLNVIAAAKACGAHVVFASTSAVYDTTPPGYPSYSENSPLGPTTPYGLAKLTAERYLDLSGISHTILRYGNVYGPRQRQVGENQLVPHCLAHLLDGKSFVIHGDGQQTRDFVYVGDIARANVLAIEGKVAGTFNCGTGVGRQIGDVCAFLAVACQRKVTFQHGPAKAGEARHVALDSSRAKQILGWEAETGIEVGLLETVAWWKEQR